MDRFDVRREFVSIGNKMFYGSMTGSAVICLSNPRVSLSNVRSVPGWISSHLWPTDRSSLVNRTAGSDDYVALLS
jgi:hypothetical protein